MSARKITDIVSAAVIGVVLGVCCAPAYSQTAPVAGEPLSFWSDMPDSELAERITAQMTDEELFGQILMFGWAGSAPDQLLYDWLRLRHMGNAKVFGWGTDNTQNVARAVASLQKTAQAGRFQIPLFIATDQEGGWIRHIKGGTSETPGNLAIGASGYPADAYYSGYYIGRELYAMGVNMNFAPTVDLFSNHESSIIGPRSFGEDPRIAGLLSAAFSAGSMDAGVIPTAKHFPGHGDTKDDSHGVLPEIKIDRDTLTNRELVPFRYLIRAHIPAIMSGHLGFPNILPSGEPASLSYVFLHDILRTEMGYTGLIITDDMMMNGATMYAGGFSIAVCMAIEAGNDIIISSTTPHFSDAVWRYALGRMQSSESFKKSVTAAAKRVIEAKAAYFKGKNPAPLYPDIEKIPQLIPDPDGKAFFLDLACRSMTFHRKGAEPLHPEAAGKVLLAGQYASFFAEGKKRYPDADTYQFGYNMQSGSAKWHGDNLKRQAARYDTVIICVSDEADASIARTVSGGGTYQTAVISIMSPFPAMTVTGADTVLLAYSYSPYSFTAAFGALCGDFEPQGELPVAYH